MTTDNNSNYCKHICSSKEDSDNLALSYLDISDQAPTNEEKKFFVNKSIIEMKDASKLDKISRDNNCRCEQ